MIDKNITINIPGINSESGLRLSDGDMDIYLKSLRLFASSIPATLDKMRAVSADTMHEYAISAHSVKGMCEYIGAEKARAAAKQLELLAKEGDSAGVLAGNESFIKETQAIIGGIVDWLKKHNTL